jgi:anti-sigma regulatory factor (Ser/Thr protein kinase)
VTAVLPGTAPAGFEHETFFYRSEPDFLDGVLPFVRDGLARDEAVVVALPEPRLALLETALAEDAGRVELLDMGDVGANPARIIAVWETAVDRHAARGRGLRGIGEPAHTGRRPAELAECQLHELLLNTAFDDGPAWRLMCPYDEAHLPRAVCAGAVASHPLRLTPAGRTVNAGYRGADPTSSAFAAALPAPPAAVLRGGFGRGDVPTVRRTVRQFARSCGVDADSAEALGLAVTELATNSVRHGGGAGTLALWSEPGAAVVEVSDPGRIADPLTGRHRPDLHQHGGRGIFLVNQLCDLVQLRSSATGTTVRISTWL